MNRRDLFGELVSKITDPIVGLKVQTPTPCKCRCAIARLAEGKWLNVPLVCTWCGMERGRLSYETLKFIRRVVETFGRPTEPIKLKRSDLSKQFPHDAGAAEASRQTEPKEPNDYERRN
jgi:hypothetical protein